MIDEVVVERAVAGHPVYMSPEERREAIRQLQRQGYGATRIARHLGMHTKTVERAIANIPETP